MSHERARPAATVVRFRGEPGVRLTAGAVSAVFLPELGLTGVSLRHGRSEFLALPGGLDQLRSGATAGLPLLAPWANRLSQWHYRVGRTRVDLRGRDVTTDANGLPIHGLLCGRSRWTVAHLGAVRSTARLRATIDVDSPAFPFPHTLEVEARVDERGLSVDTTVRATGRRAVPVGFGWHPYLRLPGTPRRHWTLHLPARRHRLLDGRGIPTGAVRDEPREAALIGSRTFDDLYEPRAGRTWAVSAPTGPSVRMQAGAGYHFAQVWVPPGRPFIALEPMTVATDALVRQDVPSVPPGDSFTARFRLILTTGNE